MSCLECERGSGIVAAATRDQDLRLSQRGWRNSLRGPSALGVLTTACVFHVVACEGDRCASRVSQIQSDVVKGVDWSKVGELQAKSFSLEIRCAHQGSEQPSSVDEDHGRSRYHDNDH